MAEFIYTMKKARKAHGEKVILDDVTLMFYPGAKIGVVGPNGAGKSTVLQIMAGLQQPSNGEAYLTPGFTVGILLQEPILDETKNVIDNVKEGVAETVSMLKRFDEISEEMANPDADYDKLLAEMGDLQEKLDHRNAWELDSQLEQAMDALRCPPADADVSVLSGGEKGRMIYGKLMLGRHNVMLMDEPTNHMDMESIESLNIALEKYAGTLIFVSHDREFVSSLATRILEIKDDGIVDFPGSYEDYLSSQGIQ